jgi:hypothetical protein
VHVGVQQHLLARHALLPAKAKVTEVCLLHGGCGLCRPGAAAGLTASSLLYDVALPEAGTPFNLKVTRKATGDAIFDTTGHQ